MNITFEIPGKLKGKDRPRFAKGRVFTPKETTIYEKKVKECFSKAKPKSFKMLCNNEPVFMEIETVQIKAKSNKYEEPTMYPDIDNILKIIMDGLNGTCYKDDKQVIGVSISKAWGDINCIYINVKTL